MIKTLIRIGHSAYSGVNAYRLCFSKAQAIRVLQNRGVKRDDARKAVNKAVSQDGACVTGEYMEHIEIVNEAHLYELGHFMRSYNEMRKQWSMVSEL